MSDKELLTAAAKAAGYEQHDHYPGHWYSLDRGIYELWNPLEDDGDALRLAVKLRLEIILSGSVSLTFVHYARDGAVTEDHGDDAAAATRRAIVRAAAAIAPQCAPAPRMPCGRDRCDRGPSGTGFCHLPGCPLAGPSKAAPCAALAPQPQEK